MRCIKRLISGDDGTPKLVLESDVEVPTPGEYEVLLQVKACCVSLTSEKVLGELFRKAPRDTYAVGQEVSGTVVRLGSRVSNVKEGDNVVGIIALDSEWSGFGEYCILHEYSLVRKPEGVSWEMAAVAVGDGLVAYTGLHYQARLCAGDTALVLDGATPRGSTMVQLAQQWGAKVITTCSTTEERDFLEKIQPPVAQIVELSSKTNILVSSVMEETGGVGVDCVVDNGVQMFTNEEDIALMGPRPQHPVPHKHDLLTCLGFAGKWVTSQPDLQLDPPDTQQLYLRGACVCFLFPDAWSLSCAQHGRYQHILQDIMNKVDKGKLKFQIAKTVTLDGVIEEVNRLPSQRIGRVVMKA